MRLKGKVALVTGASRGIGKRIAPGLASVVAARTVEPNRNPDPGTIYETAAAVTALGARALAVKCDLTARADVENLCRAALDEFGRVDILVHNAMWAGAGTYAPFLQIEPSEWDAILAVAWTSGVRAAQMLLPGMIERRSGIVIFMTSRIAKIELPGLPGNGMMSAAYGAVKAAINRFVLGVSKEFKDYGVSFMAVDPGTSQTERQLRTMKEHGFEEAIARLDPRPPEFAAAAIVNLCTCDDPMQYSGQTLEVADVNRRYGIAES